MTVALADRPARGRSKRPGRAPVIGQRVKMLGMQTACVAVLLVAWQLAVVSGAVPESEVTQPTAVAGRLWDMLATQEFWSAVGDTAHTWAIGLLVSLIVSVPLGLALGASALLYRMFRVTIDFLRTIPPVVLLPLALLLYGAREMTALLLVVFGSVWPLLLQTMYGVHQVDPVSRDVARAYQLRRRDFVRSVVLPSAAPFIATGVRIAATMSLLLAVGSELLGGVPGIGAQIAVDQTSATQIPSMYAYVVVATALGVALNLLIVGLEGRVLSWHSAHRSQQEG
jgi:ABC-type nitrate/sulfonate/bicarbonate transport system permease component